MNNNNFFNRTRGPFSSNGFNFNFEFPSLNLPDLNLTTSRFSPSNIINLLSNPRDTQIMVCDSCGAEFSILKRKKICPDCSMSFCSSCFLRDNNDFIFMRRKRCHRCRIFSMRPLDKSALMSLRVKELRWFLDKQKIPAHFCKEKTELVELILQSVDSEAPRNRFASNSLYRSTANLQSPLTSTSSADIPNTFSESHNTNFDYSGNTNSNFDMNIDMNQEQINSSIPVFRSQPVFDESETLCQASSNVSEQLNQSQNHQAQYNSPTNVGAMSVAPQNQEVTNIPDDNGSWIFVYVDENTNSVNNNNVNNSKTQISENSNKEFKPFNIDDLKSEEEIRNLSVRQIKLLLTRNFVDYKGCCEKEELLEKALRLWNDINKSKNKNDLDDDSACKICMENPVDCVFLECGHMVACIQCGKRMNECPICRQYVVRALRIFKS